jgi:hypothetical protein
MEQEHLPPPRLENEQITPPQPQLILKMSIPGLGGHAVASSVSHVLIEGKMLLILLLRKLPLRQQHQQPQQFTSSPQTQNGDLK